MAEHSRSATSSNQRLTARRPWLIISAALFPLLLIMLFLSALTYFQVGLPVFMADWQFGRFGQALPIFNIVVFVTAAVILGLLIDFVIRQARRQRDKGAATQPEGASAATAGAMASAVRFARLLAIVGGALIAVALLITLWALLLPRGAETVVFGEASGATRSVQGHLDGRLMITAVNDVLLYRDSAYFVPVVDPSQPRTIRQFVEFVPDGGWNGTSVPQVDVSKPFSAYRLALPAFTAALYAENGYTVVKPYEVLTNRPISVQLPYFITAIQLGLIGLIVLGAAWLQRRRNQRVQRMAQDESRM